MKKIIILIFLVLVLTIGNIMYLNFPFVLNLLIVCLIFWILLSSEIVVLNKYFQSDFKICSHKKKIKYESIFVSLIWTIILIYDDDIKINLFFILLYWSFPITNLIMAYVYRKKKPYTIFIKESELILNQLTLKRRNLTELNKIKFDRFSKCIYLSFENESDVEIESIEYNNDDFQRLLEIIISKSDFTVKIPANYITIKNNSH